MALPVPPLDPTNPIPNNPFYSDETYIIQGAYSPYIVGSGIYVSSEGVISASGSGGGAVDSVIAGLGISVSGPTGNVTITNTGVRSLIAGAGIGLSASTGTITITNTGATGTVSAITAGTGLTGGTITSSGTIAIANTGVTAATYTNPTLAINAQGQITAAVNGTAIASITGTAPINVSAGLNPVISVSEATTVTCGVVLLSDSVTSGVSTTAATSAAVKTAFDAAAAAIPKSCITGCGSLITGTAASTPVALPVGANKTILTADSACSSGLKWATVSSAIATPNYGNFLSTASQTAGALSTGQAVTLDSTVASNNFSIVSGSRVTAAAAGAYNLQFSIQLLSSGGGGGNVEIWLVKSGDVVPNSNTRFSIKNVNEAEFAALNFVESLTAGQYLELYWATDNLNIQLATPTSTMGGPAIPSVILTIVPVGA